jgi:uncharacterized protein (TIGR00369 family)
MAPPGGPRAGDPFSEFLGLRWNGPNEVRLTIRPDLVNNVNRLLGPVGFALIDYCMAASVWDQLADDETTATISLAVNYIASASEGEIVCRCRVDRRTRGAASTSGEVHHEDGRLLMTAIGSFAIMPARR